MNALVLALVMACPLMAAPDEIVSCPGWKTGPCRTRAADGTLTRSRTVLREVLKKYGFPGGRKGWVLDHIVSLSMGGCDRGWNVQLQTIADGKSKDRWERLPATAGGARVVASADTERDIDSPATTLETAEPAGERATYAAFCLARDAEHVLFAAHRTPALTGDSSTLALARAAVVEAAVAQVPLISTVPVGATSNAQVGVRWMERTNQTALHVLAVGHGFEVLVVDAGTAPAEVIEFKPGGDWTVLLLPRDYVGQPRLAAVTNDAVALPVLRTRPQHAWSHGRSVALPCGDEVWR